MGFTKLDSGIVKSSIWSEALATRVLWITMLAESDREGFVACSRSGLIRLANISEDEFDMAIKILESPDLDSRTPDNEGRRVARVDGGWLVLNYCVYRDREYSEIRKNQQRIASKRYREKRGIVNKNDDAVMTGVDSSVSVSASVSVSEEVNKLNISDSVEKSVVLKPKRQPKVFVIPSEAEVVGYFVENGFGSKGSDFYRYYTAGDWHDKNGNPVKNWKQKAQLWFKIDKADVQSAVIPSGYDAMVAKYGVGKGYEPGGDEEVLGASAEVCGVLPVVEPEWDGVGDDVNGVPESGVW